MLRAALVRFGCCTAREAPRIVEQLMHTGRTTTDAGHRIRLLVFGSRLDGQKGAGEFTFVPLGHIVEFIQEHLREHWDLVRHTQTKDPVLGFLLTLEKAWRGVERSRAIDLCQRER